MQALKFEELTFEQKIGLVICATPSLGDRDLSGAIEMVKNRMLGAVYSYDEKAIATLKAAADYPLLCICSAEGGYGEATIPLQIAIAASGAKEEYAYSFGKVVAALLREKGYNCINGPVLDMPTVVNGYPVGNVMRALSSDIEVTTKLAKAIARGMHDSGVLAFPKHYPGGNDVPYDTHMRPGYSKMTKEELLATRLVPYIEMMKEGLVDGVMPAHRFCPEIDPEKPASLSRPVLDILREQGFDGVAFTD
jgi:beta-N-acetylhexosaminidase